MRALVITPFAPLPANAGHRLRVLQSLSTLRRAVDRIDMLHICFEEPWRWELPSELVDQIHGLVDSYIPTPAPRNAGLQPASGEFHQLDEWWSPDLESRISELLELTTYDVVVVHNVWLTKALTLCPPRTAKVVEMHDVFYPRAEFYRRTGRAPEYFLPTQEDEIFGLNRADILISIQEDEVRLLEGLVARRMVTVPYAPLAKPEAPRDHYLDPDTLTVGFIGSAHPFNVDGLNSFLAALEAQIRESFAPVDVVIAGRVCAHVRTSLPVRLMGEVETERELYDAADIVVAPLFDGSGLKIKVVDAIGRGMPVLCARHAAKGIPLPDPWVLDTPEELAAAIAEMAWTRPSRRELGRVASSALDGMVRATERGEEELAELLRHHRPSVLLNAGDTPASNRLLRTTVYLSYARVLRDHFRVSVVVHPSLQGVIQSKIATGVRVFTDMGEAERLTSPSLIIGRGSASGVPCVADHRFGDPPTPVQLAANFGEPQHGAINCYAPLLTGPFFWEPATQALLALHGATREAGPEESVTIDEMVTPDGRLETAALLDVFLRPRILSQAEIAPSHLSPAQNAVLGDLISTARLADFELVPGEVYAAASDDVWLNRAKADRSLVALLRALEGVRQEAA